MAAGKAFMAAVRRDLSSALNSPGDWLQNWLFFLVVVSLFPLGTRPEPELLQTLAPGVIWVAALLSVLLGLERLFRTEFDDASLEQLLLSPVPLPLLIFAKIFAHWLMLGLPLVLLAPLLGIMLGLPSAALSVLVVSLLLGTPSLILLGSIGAALTVSVRRSGALLALLMLPLFVPVLILGAQSVAVARDGLPAHGQLYLLGSLLALNLILAPLAAAASLRIVSE